MRDKPACGAVQRDAIGGTEPPPHALIGFASLAWPGMVVEVTAALPA